MKYLYSLIFIGLLLGCESDTANRNPYLPDLNFRFDLNLNLPLYNDLNNIGNPVYVDNVGVGVRGAYVMRTGPSENQFLAWEASCPNHAPNSCSTTILIESQTVQCGCDDGYRYNLFTGQQLDRPNDGNRYYDLLFYQAVQAGNSVIISN